MRKVIFLLCLFCFFNYPARSFSEILIYPLLSKLTESMQGRFFDDAIPKFTVDFLCLIDPICSTRYKVIEGDYLSLSEIEKLLSIFDKKQLEQIRENKKICARNLQDCFNKNKTSCTLLSKKLVTIYLDEAEFYYSFRQRYKKPLVLSFNGSLKISDEDKAELLRLLTLQIEYQRIYLDNPQRSSDKVPACLLEAFNLLQAERKKNLSDTEAKLKDVFVQKFILLNKIKPFIGF